MPDRPSHRHLPGALIGARRGHRQLLADGPETEQADAELALQPDSVVGLQATLDRVADVPPRVGAAASRGPAVRLTSVDAE